LPRGTGKNHDKPVRIVGASPGHLNTSHHYHLRQLALLNEIRNKRDRGEEEWE
jgi:hypothetical protein